MQTSELTGSPQEITVAGGDWSRAVLGTKVVNKQTTIHNYGKGSSDEACVLPPGHFSLHPLIIVSEKDPISAESRIFRAKLRNNILGDVEVAVKILSDGERQRREAKMHWTLPHHKNIVERIMVDTFKYKGQACIYIAMEQCDPQNLYSHVISQVKDNVPFDSEKFMSFAYQTGCGLEFLHRHKILNRDLKPDNILLTKDKKTVKIADFGMSKENESEQRLVTQSIIQPGAIGWRSPEILNKVQRISLASDIFSLGLIFHFLWSYGKHPFGDDPDEWNLNIKRGRKMNLRLKFSNNNFACSLLKSMLKQDPEERPDALQILRHEVFRETQQQSAEASIFGNHTASTSELDLNEESSESMGLFGKLWLIAGKKVGKRKECKTVLLQEGVRRDPDTGSSNVESDSIKFGDSWEVERCEIQLAGEIEMGCFGRVRKGMYKDEEIAVAEFGRGGEIEDKFLIQADALKNLQHKNVAKMIGIVSDAPAWIVMELMDERSLLCHLRLGSAFIQTMKGMCGAASQICCGMDYIGKMGYVHRNLRAGSILLGKSLVCKIANFGRSRHADDKGVYESQGSYALKWLATESTRDHHFTFKSDVWSFGILLIEIFTDGRLPYPDMSNRQAIVRVRHGYRMPKPTECPDAIYDVMLQCWDKDPEERPTFEYLENFFNSMIEDKKDHQGATSVPPRVKETEKGPSAVALYSYEADSDDKIGFKTGDVITDIGTELDDGWWHGTLKGKEGFFPASYVELLD